MCTGDSRFTHLIESWILNQTSREVIKSCWYVHIINWDWRCAQRKHFTFSCWMWKTAFQCQIKSFCKVQLKHPHDVRISAFVIGIFVWSLYIYFLLSAFYSLNFCCLSVLLFFHFALWSALGCIHVWKALYSYQT